MALLGSVRGGGAMRARRMGDRPGRAGIEGQCHQPFDRIFERVI